MVEQMSKPAFLHPEYCCVKSVIISSAVALNSLTELSHLGGMSFST